ncbi:DNA primase [Sphingobacterium alkalisoli]|uniref:DNA primase n=1 Tax=Sphingobacterium alkalisoli TaxID=1874115 RepID=A0A4U0GX90_9SPHI|nr:toprim domain-containing protein [Sphingobacterium alkalisoli]TJY63743.1 DNA primase [Sphingobacterium alkalisoli]GGH25169.1 DNA primase [Sphingobacterium alkalisoli]
MGSVKINCAYAREIDLVDYLSKLGIVPVKVRGHNFWYHSPFRSEKTPSFKVNRKLNRWYDFGEGTGGTIIDFATRFKDCTIGEFLRSIRDNDFSFPVPACPQPIKEQYTTDRITLISDHTLSSDSLIHYLKKRRIPIAIADNYCREVRYSIASRTYYAIGFQNRAGGWELRNAYFKGSSSPKDFTILYPHRSCLCVFEGFIDFLSFITLVPEAENTYSFLVLNSLSFFEKARPIMEAYIEVWLFLDNDTAGQNCSRYATSLSAVYNDQSSLYQNHKDLNDWHCFPGNPNCDLPKLLDPP